MNVAGRPYGGIADRQSNPIAEQGAVYIGAAYDISQKIAVQRQNKDLGASLYGGAENEQVWNVTPGGLLYSVLGAPKAVNSMADAKMTVLECLNGQGVAESARYGNDPRKYDIVRLAVKNKIAFMGCAFEALEATRGKVERGITVQLAGLRTLPFGNGRFGEATQGANLCKPGDLLCVDVPVPGRDGLMPGGGHQSRQGVPVDRYTLQVRRCSTLSPGQALLTHAREILRDEAKWKVAMGERLNGTAAWASAVSELFNSYLTAGILFTRRLMADGLVVPSKRGALLASQRDQGALTEATKAANNLNIQLNAATMSSAADRFAAHLAEALNVVSTTTYGVANRVNTLSAKNNAEIVKAARTLRMNMLQEIFYSGVNTAFEFGFTPSAGNNGAAQSTARYRFSGKVDASQTDGALLEAQMDHVTRATASMYRAILDDQRFFLGKAATGATQYGSGNVHVFISKTA